MTNVDVVLCSFVMTEELAKQIWEVSYPDRKPWKDLSKETQDEWIRVFTIAIQLFQAGIGQ